MGKTDIEDDDLYEFKGVKIAHELMVDILGALIPGALFLFCTIVCIVFPLICYATPNNSFGFLMKDGDWFWIVAFLSFLILSYVIGLIFYRADIKVPDRCDIRREQKKKLISFVDGLLITKDDSSKIVYSAKMLLGEVVPLLTALNESEIEFGFRKPYDDTYRNKCKEVVDYLNRVIQQPEIFSCPHFDPTLQNNDYCVGSNNNEECQIYKDKIQFLKDILNVLFPESISSSLPSNSDSDSKYFRIAESMFPGVKCLPVTAKIVLINTVKVVPLVEAQTRLCKLKRCRHFRMRLRLWLINHNCIITGFKHRWEASYNPLMVAYLILHMQNESGCATEKRCDFPYISYYKYLLKRRQYNLLKYADWSTSAARTKNRINKYKIELQLNVPTAYSIISKNESHIRMASSSWHVARVIRILSIISLIFTIGFGIAGIYYHKDNNSEANRTEIKAEIRKKHIAHVVLNYNELISVH